MNQEISEMGGQVLPSFSAPPLDEVVLGIQFDAPPSYNSSNLAEVYDLFRDKFPRFDEQPRLVPQFETFGGNARPGFQMEFGPPPLRSRSMFISADDNHLIQFQDDRLLLNWRQGSNGASYPRFDRIALSFTDVASKLMLYFKSKFDYNISINQTEISYINIIKVHEFNDVGNYFNFLGVQHLNAENIAVNITEVISRNAKPIARLHQELNSVYSIDGRQKAIRFSLTVRGKPSEETLSSSVEFLNIGHEIIVNRFADLTTERAHAEWGRH